MIDDDDLEWYRMTPQQGWAESLRLWDTFILLGGSLEAEPDSQSPSTIRKHDARSVMLTPQIRTLCGAAACNRQTQLAPPIIRLQGRADVVSTAVPGLALNPEASKDTVADDEQADVR